MNRSPPPPTPTTAHPMPIPTSSQPQQQQQPQPDMEPPSKITPELLVDALSGHEDGLLSIAEKLMLSYDSGYDAMGEAIIDAFADVQKLFQHVVEAAHMEGAALERERSEGEWRTRLEGMGLEMEDVLYGRGMGMGGLGGMGLLGQEDDEFGGLDGAISPIKGEAGGSGYNSSPHHTSHHGDDNNHPHPNGSSLNTPTTKQSAAEEHRHEELIDQDVRDVLIDAIRRGQTHRESHRFDDCRTLYEMACTNASSLLPVDSDHRGRLQLAIARAESMASDRAVAILKYAMDDVLRSGLSLRRGKYVQMNVEERGDCVLSRPNPLRTTASRGYDVPLSTPWGNSSSSHQHPTSSTSMGGDVTSSTVEQSAEEALNSLVEEMKEMLAAPIYNLTPLQSLAEKFWLALNEAKKSSSKKEERLEQSLAKIKADFLLAREEYEEQLTNEKERGDALKRRLYEMKLDNSSSRGHDEDGDGGGGEGLSVPYTPKRPPSSTSRSSGGGSGTGNSTNLLYHFVEGNNNSINNKHSSSQSVVSLGSEFAQKARGLVHLLNCQAGGNERNNNNRDNVLKFRTRSEEEEEKERLNYDQRRIRGDSPRL